MENSNKAFHQHQDVFSSSSSSLASFSSLVHSPVHKIMNLREEEEEEQQEQLQEQPQEHSQQYSQSQLQEQPQEQPQEHSQQCSQQCSQSQLVYSYPKKEGISLSNSKSESAPFSLGSLLEPVDKDETIPFFSPTLPGRDAVHNAYKHLVQVSFEPHVLPNNMSPKQYVRIMKSPTSLEDVSRCAVFLQRFLFNKTFAALSEHMPYRLVLVLDCLSKHIQLFGLWHAKTLTVHYMYVCELYLILKHDLGEESWDGALPEVRDLIEKAEHLLDACRRDVFRAARNNEIDSKISRVWVVRLSLSRIYAQCGRRDDAVSILCGNGSFPHSSSHETCPLQYCHGTTTTTTTTPLALMDDLYIYLATCPSNGAEILSDLVEILKDRKRAGQSTDLHVQALVHLLETAIMHYRREKGILERKTLQCIRLLLTVVDNTYPEKVALENEYEKLYQTYPMLF